MAGRLRLGSSAPLPKKPAHPSAPLLLPVYPPTPPGFDFVQAEDPPKCAHGSPVESRCSLSCAPVTAPQPHDHVSFRAAPDYPPQHPTTHPGQVLGVCGAAAPIDALRPLTHPQPSVHLSAFHGRVHSMVVLPLKVSPTTLRPVALSKKWA